MNELNKDNQMPFFPTSETWMQAKELPKVPLGVYGAAALCTMSCNTGRNPFISLYPTFLYRVETAVLPAQSLNTKET
jgi:hypothetical protein